MPGSLARDDVKSSFLKDSESEKALKVLYEHVESDAKQKIEWYHRKKVWKGRISKGLHLIAIVLFALGSLVPILEVTFPAMAVLQSHSIFDFSQAGYLLIAIAAACFGLDRFFGHSSGWVRHVTTAMAIERALEEYRMEWTRVTAKNAGHPYRPEVIDGLIRLSKDFVLSTLALVDQETRLWATEFHHDIAHLDRDISARGERTQKEIIAETEPLQYGAVSLTVANGTESDQGFSVLLDDKFVEGNIQENKCEILSVAPGLHKLRIAGTIGKEAAFASDIISVQPGLVLRHNLTLKSPNQAIGEGKVRKSLPKVQPSINLTDSGNGRLPLPANTNGKGKQPQL